MAHPTRRDTSVRACVCVCAEIEACMARHQHQRGEHRQKHNREKDTKREKRNATWVTTRVREGDHAGGRRHFSTRAADFAPYVAPPTTIPTGFSKCLPRKPPAPTTAFVASLVPGLKRPEEGVAVAMCSGRPTTSAVTAPHVCPMPAALSPPARTAAKNEPGPTCAPTGSAPGPAGGAAVGCHGHTFSIYPNAARTSE